MSQYADAHDSERVLAGVDAGRRVAWAKYYDLAEAINTARWFVSFARHALAHEGDLDRVSAFLWLVEGKLGDKNLPNSITETKFSRSEAEDLLARFLEEWPGATDISVHIPPRCVSCLLSEIAPEEGRPTPNLRAADDGRDSRDRRASQADLEARQRRRDEASQAAKDRTEADRVRRGWVYESECPYCGSAPGELCKSASGKEVPENDFHSDRLRKRLGFLLSTETDRPIGRNRIRVYRNDDGVWRFSFPADAPRVDPDPFPKEPA